MKTYFYEIRHTDGPLISKAEFRKANNINELITALDIDYNLNEEVGEGNWFIRYMISRTDEMDLKANASLNAEKEKAYKRIDNKTNELLGEGFLYNNHTFSLSIAAQMNWSEIHTNKDIITFPLEISTKDNDVYNLTYEEVDVFWATGATTLRKIVDSGRELKKQVRQALTKTDVRKIKDDR